MSPSIEPSIFVDSSNICYHGTDGSDNVYVSGFLKRDKVLLLYMMMFFSNDTNRSSCVLIQSELFVISKGVPFCPVPDRVDKLQVRQDLESDSRFLRLRVFWLFHRN